MFGQNLHTLLNKMKPASQENYNNSNELFGESSAKRSMEVGLWLRMRNYRSAGPKWAIATVVKKLGKRSFEVKEEKVSIIHKRDIDQLVALPPLLQKKTETSDTPDCGKRNRLLDLPIHQTTEEEGDDNPVAEPKQRADEEMQDSIPERRRRTKRRCVEDS